MHFLTSDSQSITKLHLTQVVLKHRAGHSKAQHTKQRNTALLFEALRQNVVLLMTRQSSLPNCF